MDAEGLAPDQRAERYRQMADDQRELAARALLTEIKSKHLELAALWMRLAEEAERRSQPATDDRWDRLENEIRGAGA